MKKTCLVISILLSCVLLKAQTGVGDSFESYPVTNVANPFPVSPWATNSQYKLAIINTTPPSNNQLHTTFTTAASNFNGFTYAFSPIDMTDAPLVSVKIKSGTQFSLRIDLIDVNENRTNQVNTTLQIKADVSKYQDYLFDFSGRFLQQNLSGAPITVLSTQIKRIEFIVNAGSAASSGSFLLDSVMVGTRAKTNYTFGAKGIKLNQLGFYKEGSKKIVINGGSNDKFYIVNNSLTDTVYTGTLSEAKEWELSGETVRIADFTNFKTPGTYRMRVPGIGLPSYPFVISTTVLNGISKASIKGFYYQRASTALLETHAGIWKRAGGHFDTQVRIHNSAVSPGRPKDFTISSPRGWYDAGDYNKYIVNSGISTYTLLACYEHFSTYYDTLKLNIPESSNAIPDVLDEALYNIRWMFTMQDPYDGGVYHKLTNANFDGNVMPSAATSPRYVVQKSTGATLDFAAVMAQSARIYSEFSNQLPGLSDSCIKAAKRAYDWAILNPSVFYNQNTLSNPSINTGAYDDWSFADEKSWAAAELFTTTQLPEYYLDIDLSRGADIPGWQNVYTLGLISLAHNRVLLGSNIDSTFIKNKIIALANSYRNTSDTSAYGIAMGTYNWNFGWGSNSGAANQAMILIQAFNYTKDVSYLNAAVSNADYLLGRNGLSFSFVTGYGSNFANNPHQRVAQADGIPAAIPGFLVGGPNSGQQDNCQGYTSSLPALSYVDNDCSYSTNEIAINWNAPLAYITGSIQSIYSGIKPSAKTYDISTSNKSAVLKNINIHVYPNPTSSSLHVEKPFDLIAAPVVLDLNGLEYTISSDWSGAGNTIQINTSQLQSGLYMIRLQGENGAAVQKFTIVK